MPNHKSESLWVNRILYTALKTGVTPEINALCTLLLAATLLLVGLSMLWSKISHLTGNGR